jgi:predicted tellurium resistance membrane protein TerC
MPHLFEKYATLNIFLINFSQLQIRRPMYSIFTIFNLSLHLLVDNLILIAIMSRNLLP